MLKHGDLQQLQPWPIAKLKVNILANRSLQEIRCLIIYFERKLKRRELHEINVWERKHLHSMVSQVWTRALQKSWCGFAELFPTVCDYMIKGYIITHVHRGDELNLHRQIGVNFPLCSLMRTSFLIIYFLFHCSVNLEHRSVLLKLRVVFVYGIIW